MRSHESRLTRLEKLEEECDPQTAWERTEGLCALLAAARRLPKRIRDLPELEDDATGLGRLLREARQWAERGGMAEKIWVVHLETWAMQLMYMVDAREAVAMGDYAYAPVGGYDPPKSTAVERPRKAAA